MNSYFYYSLIKVDLWVKIVRYGQQDPHEKQKGRAHVVTFAISVTSRISKVY